MPPPAFKRKEREIYRQCHMKMIFSLKSLSRSAVHQEHHHDQKSKNPDGKCTSLTVWRKSLITSCRGFTVINSNGDLEYRVDNYIDRPEELTLMDGSGKSILTMRRRRKKLGVIADSWLVYEGEGSHYGTRSKPIWCVKRNINILQGNNNVLAYVFRGPSWDKNHSYVIEGSYTNRSCKVLDESRRVVAEIKRKEAIIGGVSFGVEVFLLIVESGFDAGFAMGLVLLLDRMFS